MDVSDIVLTLNDPGMKPAERVRRSGISRDTEWSLRRDPSRANLSTLRELALASGNDLVVEAVPASDPLASAAARVILGDLTTTSPELDQWVTRLRRWVPSADPLRLVEEASRVSAPQHRSGAVLLNGRNDPDRLASAAIAAQARWVLSGATCLEALGEATEPECLPVVMWVSDSERASRFLGDTHRRVHSVAAADVIVAPLHESMLEGSVDLDDVPLVSPVQAIIDSIGVGGQLGQTALEIARSGNPDSGTSLGCWLQPIPQETGYLESSAKVKIRTTVGTTDATHPQRPETRDRYYLEYRSNGPCRHGEAGSVARASTIP